MKIKTVVCSRHRPRFGWTQGNAAHAYRSFIIGPARRCPTQVDPVTSYLLTAPPSIERQTLDEVRAIRQLLEQERSPTPWPPEGPVMSAGSADNA